ncbi:hypothetical protein ACJX0J_007902, partial [Zea mays]
MKQLSVWFHTNLTETCITGFIDLYNLVFVEENKQKRKKDRTKALEDLNIDLFDNNNIKNRIFILKLAHKNSQERQAREVHWSAFLLA